MVTRFFFNVILAFAWCLLHDEISLRQFVIGFLVGLLVMLFFPRSFHQERRYFRKLMLSVQLALFFVKELLIANWTVVRQVLAWKLAIRPGIVAYPLSLQNDVLITLLANMITLTPGTLSVEVSPDRQFLFIHFLDVADVEEEIRIIKDGFERYLLLIAQ